MNKYFSRLFTPKVIVSALVVALGLLVLGALLVVVTAPVPTNPLNLIAYATVIPNSQQSASISPPANDPYIPTPTPTPAPGQISIGSVVQVTNTEGVGLRFRSQPSLTGNEVFMGFDTEVFKVVDGPRQLDGYTWYFLASINNENRTGWAVSNYLTSIPNQ